MIALRLLSVAALSAACCTQGRVPMGGEPVQPPRAALPRASGPVIVRGGEIIELEGARVTIGVVTYLDQPCPPDVQCLHSGVMKLVEFRVLHSAAVVSATVPAGERRVVEGVEVAVRAVRAGPEADVEVSLPLAPAR